MSITGIIEAMRTPTSRRALGVRLVWQCLENHANGARCWRMTEKAIAAELGLGINTVSRAIQCLIADGIIKVERFRRRPSVFRMQRSYAKPNGQTPQDHGDLTPQNGESTLQHHGDLTPQNGHSKHELTPQNGDSMVELTPQNGGTKNPPVRIHQKDPPATRAKTRSAHGLVNGNAQAFEVWWQAYPRKVAKGYAAKAYAKALALTDHETLLNALDRRWGSAKYIPHPATWLNGQRWLDETDSGDPVLRAVGLDAFGNLPDQKPVLRLVR